MAILIRLLSQFPLTFRISQGRGSIKKSVLKNLTKFTGKLLCRSLFFNKVAGLRRATLLKKLLRRKCFPVNFAKFLRTTFLQNTSRRQFLEFPSNKDLKARNIWNLPWDIEILGWCLAESVLPHGGWFLFSLCWPPF